MDGSSLRQGAARSADKPQTRFVYPIVAAAAALWAPAAHAHGERDLPSEDKPAVPVIVVPQVEALDEATPGKRGRRDGLTCLLNGEVKVAVRPQRVEQAPVQLAARRVALGCNPDPHR